MLDRDYCQTLIEQVIHAGKNLSTDGIEVHVYGSNIATSRFANNSMTQNQAPSRIKLAVRVIKDERQARMSTEDLSKEGLETLVKDTALAASLLEREKDLPSLYDGAGADKDIVSISCYEAATAQLNPRERCERVGQMISIAKENGLSAAGTYSTGALVSALGNSNGLFAYHRESSVEASITMVASGSTGWAKAHASDANQIDLSVLSARAASKALGSDNARDIAPGIYTVILEPAATLDLLGFLWPDLAATSHIDKLSCLLNKVGKKVFADRLTVYDDVRHPLQVGAKFDDEGVLRQSVCLIENGVVKNLVYGRRAALKLNAKPTGHGLGEPNAYGETPRNIVMSGGTKTVDDLIASSDHAILLTRVWYVREINPATKLITGMTRDGTFMVKDGKIAHALKNLRFNVSVVDMLSNILELGKSVRTAAEESYPAVVPALKVGNFHFSSNTMF
jgi:predicted Zn-dependent protease